MSTDNIDEVVRYYKKIESRVGYGLLLGGTKHFGFYGPDALPWNWPQALRKMEDRLARTLGLPPGSNVLDAGCGNGGVAVHLAQDYKLRVSGIDILRFNVEKARRRSSQRGLNDLLNFREMSYANLDFPDNFFDGVYTMETLVHASDAEKVLAQFIRVLKPGGRAVLFEYSRDPESLMSTAAAQAFRDVARVAAMPSFQRFEHGVLARLLKEGGFRSISVEDITSNMLPMLRCFALIGRLLYAIGRAIGHQDDVINAMSAVEFWRYRKHFRYNIYSAVK